MLIILTIVLSYASSANTALLKDASDDNIKAAQGWVSYSLIIGWPVWIGIVIGIIALIILGPELIPYLGKTIAYLGVVIIIILIIVIAVCCIVATYYIRQSTSKSTEKATAQSDIETAAVSASITVIFVFVAYYYIYRVPKAINLDEYPSDRSPYYSEPTYGTTPSQATRVVPQATRVVPRAATRVAPKPLPSIPSKSTLREAESLAAREAPMLERAAARA